MLLLAIVPGAWGGLGCDTFCQSGPKYGTKCYAMGGPVTIEPPPAPVQGSVHECVPVGEGCQSDIDCCKEMASCSAGVCVVVRY